MFRPILESSWLSLHSPGPPGGEVNDTWIGSWSDYFRMSLLGGDIFSRGGG
jgi:hypothetical protein